MTPRLVSSFATPPVFCPARRLLAVASPRLVCSFFSRLFFARSSSSPALLLPPLFFCPPFFSRFLLASSPFSFPSPPTSQFLVPHLPSPFSQLATPPPRLSW